MDVVEADDIVMASRASSPVAFPSEASALTDSASEASALTASTSEASSLAASAPEASVITASASEASAPTTSASEASAPTASASAPTTSASAPTALASGASAFPASGSAVTSSGSEVSAPTLSSAPSSSPEPMSVASCSPSSLSPEPTASPPISPKRTFFEQFSSETISLASLTSAPNSQKFTVFTSTAPPPDVKTSVGFSKQEVHQLNFTWIIENFKYISLDEWGDRIHSPLFEDPPIHESEWRLEFGRYNSDKLPILSLYARLISSKKEPLNVKYKFSLLNANGRPLYCKEQLPGPRGIQTDETIGWSDFITFKEVCNYLIGHKGGNLIINCIISVVGKITNSPPEIGHCNYEVQSTYIQDLERLLVEGIGSDMAVRMDGKEFRCHKNILAARSPVFAKMFLQLGFYEYNGTTEDKVDIPSMDERALREMLRYIYTDTVLDIENIAIYLLHAAHQFELNRLKAMCESQLAKDLTVNNCVGALQCAKRYSSNGLKQQAKMFISINIKDVLKTDAFKRFMEEETDLANEVMKSALGNGP